MANQIMLSIVVPCYNEFQVILNTIKTIKKSLKYNFIKNYEIIIVDDKSIDNTKYNILDIKKKNPKSTKLIFNKSNLGLGGSLMKGFKISKGEYIMWLPGDNAHSIKDIIKLTRQVRTKKYDIIIPLNNNSSRSNSREIFSKIYVLLINIIFQKNIKYYNGAIIYKKKILKKAIKLNLSKSHFFLAETLIRSLKYVNKYLYVACSVKKQNISNAIRLSSLIKIVIDIVKVRIRIL